MQKNKQAFTLIELLVVVLIIGILAAVALPQYKIAVYKSRYATLKNLVKTFVNAQEVYYLANGKYAEKISDLDIDLPGGKLDTSTENRYDYTWGYCNVGPSNSAKCNDAQIKMQYQVRYAHITSPNRRYCIIWDATTSDIRNQVCKNETGAASGTQHTEENYISWIYKN